MRIAALDKSWRQSRHAAIIYERGIATGIQIITSTNYIFSVYCHLELQETMISVAVET